VLNAQPSKLDSCEITVSVINRLGYTDGVTLHGLILIIIIEPCTQSFLKLGLRRSGNGFLLGRTLDGSFFHLVFVITEGVSKRSRRSFSDNSHRFRSGGW
jgi:hypothetical protein